MESDAGTSNEGYFLTEDVRSALKIIMNKFEKSKVVTLNNQRAITITEDEIKEIFGEELVK